LHRLNIDVAERTRESAHRLRNLNAGIIYTHVDDILQSSVSAGGVVVQGDRAGDGVLAVLQVLVLPDPPGAVDLCVVEEEGGISWGDEDVSAWVTTDGEVASRVYAAEKRLS
jgi:hypothetical protein